MVSPVFRLGGDQHRRQAQELPGGVCHGLGDLGHHAGDNAAPARFPGQNGGQEGGVSRLVPAAVGFHLAGKQDGFPLNARENHGAVADIDHNNHKNPCSALSFFHYTLMCLAWQILFSNSVAIRPRFCYIFSDGFWSLRI